MNTRRFNIGHAYVLIIGIALFTVCQYPLNIPNLASYFDIFMKSFSFLAIVVAMIYFNKIFIEMSVPKLKCALYTVGSIALILATSFFMALPFGKLEGLLIFRTLVATITTLFVLVHYFRNKDSNKLVENSN